MLNRPEIRERFPDLSHADVAQFLAKLVRSARLVEHELATFRFERDPKDEFLLELAIAAQVDWLVTWEKDLFDLSRQDNAISSGFPSRSPNTRIVEPPDFAKNFPQFA